MASHMATRWRQGEHRHRWMSWKAEPAVHRRRGGVGLYIPRARKCSRILANGSGFASGSMSSMESMRLHSHWLCTRDSLSTPVEDDVALGPIGTTHRRWRSCLGLRYISEQAFHAIPIGPDLNDVTVSIEDGHRGRLLRRPPKAIADPRLDLGSHHPSLCSRPTLHARGIPSRSSRASLIAETYPLEVSLWQYPPPRLEVANKRWHAQEH